MTNGRWEPPIEVVRLGIAAVLLADRPVAVGRVTLTNDVVGSIDFAACCSVQPPPGDYVIRLASGAEHACRSADVKRRRERR